MGKPNAPPEPMELVRTAIWACGHGADELFEEAIAALSTAPTDRLAAGLTSRLREQVARQWRRGWQPSDLHRVIARRLGSQEASLLAGIVVVGSRSYRTVGEQLAPRWIRQVDSLARGSVLHLTDDAAPWVDLLVAGVRLSQALEELPELPLGEPPPSAWRVDTLGPAPPAADEVLDAVRTLLARTGPTEPDDEAGACTLEAQEVATRHRIDRAVRIAVGGASGPDVVGRRLRIDDPYADAKAALLAGICAANGARAVWSEHAGAATVFGFPTEVDVVDALFTSLLVRSSAALRREGSKHDRFGRSRTTRFRRAFLHAFAAQATRSLRAVADATLEADHRRSSVVPAIEAQDAAVAAAASRAFPDTTAVTPTRFDGRERWVEATLFDDLLEHPSAS